MGATKYASYNAETETIEIDWAAIDKITDENLGSAVEQYISYLESTRDDIQDIQDQIEEANDNLKELRERGKDEYLDFENKIRDALVAQREKEIETLEEINSTVKDAADKTIDAIQDEISKERQVRQNDETEQNILDKEMRLAYLQRDTSGANDLEIQKLQKEISKDQQSYQDSIVDQTIQEMRDEADRAEQQRQAQIDLLQLQLQQYQDSGDVWNDVKTVLQSGFDKNGIKPGSELESLLKWYDKVDAKSKFGKFQWTDDTNKEVKEAIVGLYNYTLDEAKRQSGKLTLADENGTVLRYNAETKTWYDAKTKQSYTDEDLYWDPQANGFRLTQEALNRNNKPTGTQTGSSGTTTPTTPSNTPKYVEYTVQKNDGPWQVAKAIYGSEQAANAQWQDVYAQLQSQGIYELHPGQVVKIQKRYAQGGLADFTGPAWLDGSKSRPELVLNAADTQNFIALKNILAQILNSAQSSNKAISGGDNYFDIDIQAEIDSDYDVDRLADRIKQQIAEEASYRNVNAISTVR